MGIHNFLLNFNLMIGKAFPRHATRFAKKQFGRRPIDVIEIGTMYGTHALSILNELGVNQIYLIDPYQAYDEEGKTNFQLREAEYKAYKKLGGHEHQTVFIKRTSDDAVKLVPMADFIYIDGDHSYEQTLKDMENYWKKVRKDGILAGHDIASHEHPGVAKALLEFCSKNNLVPTISRTDWWIVKP